jgi:predicted nuclease of predicted toxin-antitoxin system
MKLLFDHNLSPRLVDRLADLFPESTHIYTLGMDRSEDREVWIYAQSNDFTIVTRDGDYNELLVLRGFPPKIVWIRRGNCSTAVIEGILRAHVADIQALATDPTLGILTLY